MPEPTAPHDVVWGVAQTSLGAEGAADTSDWYRWELTGHAPASGDGNGFAEHYADDLALFALAGVGHLRLTLEWARLEPMPGWRDPVAVERNLDLLRRAKELGISVWACLHDVSLPGWFAEDEHGFLDDRSRGYLWPRHLDWCAETFGDLVAGWIPIGEPLAFAQHGWLTGAHPPGRRDLDRFRRSLCATMLALREGWRVLRSSAAPVATAFDVHPIRALVIDPRVQVAANDIDRTVWAWVRYLREGTLAIPGLPDVEHPDLVGAFDLVGITYTNAHGVDATGRFAPYPPDARVGPLGVAPWPEGLRLCLERVAEDLPGRPLLVTGYGVGTTDEAWREELVRDGLAHVDAARADGIDVQGFFHRGAVDGYETWSGFGEPWGLWDPDRAAKPALAVLQDRFSGLGTGPDR